MGDVDGILQNNTFRSNAPSESRAWARPPTPSYDLSARIHNVWTLDIQRSASTMEPGSIELKIISCQDLKNFNFFQKLTIYALVYIHSIDPNRKLDEKQVQEQKTHTDKEGNENPEWNQAMKFHLSWVSLHDCDDLFLHFEFRHDGLIIGDKIIGEVRVPLKDLILEAGSAPGVVRFVKYEVRNSERRPNGIFNFSYKKEAETRISPENVEAQITGYPPLEPVLTDHYPPPNESCIQTSTSETQSVSGGDRISYPIVTLPVDPIDVGLNSPSAPPLKTSPSTVDYNYHYSPISPQYPPPPAVVFMPPTPPPPPFPMHYPYPPPPPPPHMGAYGPRFYEPVRPEDHGWASHPNFQQYWSSRW